MDVRKWLAETERPILFEQSEVEAFNLPRHLPAERARKRKASNSSLLKIQSPQPRHKGVLANERDRQNVHDADDDGLSDAFLSGSGDTSLVSNVSQRFSRQPRRKIRADKYEVPSKRAKEQDEGRRPCRKNVPGKSKRKSRRKKDDRTHNGIGQEFQGSNVSKDRLTLNPSEKPGLFRKGRTSTVVKGRGLPDLVFSEMKFLRDSRDGDDHTAQAGGPKKRKKDHTKTREDISAFFTTVRPALAATVSNTHPGRGGGRSASARADYLNTTLPDTPKVSHIAVPVVESENEPSYLGFGNRGPKHESTSDISWSESIRPPRITPERTKGAPADQDKRIDASNQRIVDGFGGGGTIFHQEVTSPTVHDRMGDVSTRYSVSSADPKLSRVSRSHSLPRPAYPQRRNLVDPAAELNCYRYEDAASLSSMPPLFSGLQTGSALDDSIETSRSNDDVGSARRGACTETRPAYECAITLPEVGVTPQQFNDIPKADSRLASSCRRTVVQTSHRPPETVRQTGQSRHPRFAQAGTVRFVAMGARTSVLPNFCGPGIYAQQEQRQLLPAHAGLGVDGRYRFAEDHRHGYMGEVEVLDQDNLDDLSGGQIPYGLLKDIEDDDDDDDGGMSYVSDRLERVEEPEHASVVRPGFWRPNRLY